MTWRHYLQVQTRNPAFLWRMVIAILALGIVAGAMVEGQLIGRGIANIDRDEGRKVVERLDDLAAAGQWRELWWSLPEVVFKRTLSLAPTLLALFAGFWWFVFCLQAAQVRRRDLQWILLPLAVVLGGISVWPTHFLNMWIEHRWGIEDSAELVNGLRFYILGVGLPEEAAKLLCFLPLIPILLRIRSDLTALVAAACVGLGFAIMENIGYFSASRGIDTVGRFLTANPMHMTLTGISGLAAYRAARDFRGWGSHAIAMIALMVFAHGIYDAAIVIPELAKLEILASVVLALVVYQFFRELRELQSRRVNTISLTANFLAGLSLTIAATFIYISGMMGFRPAFITLSTDVISLAVMAYLFLREMPETMVTV